jgi:hypothetical protein
MFGLGLLLGLLCCHPVEASTRMVATLRHCLAFFSLGLLLIQGQSAPTLITLQNLYDPTDTAQSGRLKEYIVLPPWAVIERPLNLVNRSSLVVEVWPLPCSPEILAPTKGAVKLTPMLNSKDCFCSSTTVVDVSAACSKLYKRPPSSTRVARTPP